jgi:hypothetical protein
VIAGSEAEAFVQPNAMPVARGMTDTMGMMGYPPTIKVTSAYSAAAAMATSPDMAAAYLAAEPKLRALKLTLLRVLAADKEGRHGLLKQLGFELLPPDMVSVLAGYEIERLNDAKQDRKWIFEKVIVIMIALGGWLAAIAVALFR